MNINCLRRIGTFYRGENLVSEFLRVNWARTIFGGSSQEFVEGVDIKNKQRKESSMNPSFELKTD